MDANLEQDLARLDYNETEIARRLGVVMADLNQYVCKKYPELKDADVIERPRNSRSVLDLCGIRVKQKDSGKPVFICLMGKCFASCERMKITWQSTSNATTHLFGKHGVVAGKTEAHNRNVATLNKYIEGADQQFVADPIRWFQVHLSAFACENSIAFSAFDSPTWKLIANKLPVGKNKSLETLNLRKHYIEHYVSIKQHIIERITAAKATFNLPFMSLSLDLIQNEVQNRKMIGVRVTYVHNSTLTSHWTG